MTSRTLRTEITINASPKIIWDILVDFEKFPSWNPFIKSITGTPGVGQKLRVCVHPPHGSAMTFRPTILALQSKKHLVWKGKFLFPGLFDGEHRFILEEKNESTLFIQEELFSGLLVGIFPASLYQKTEAGFKVMNAALKTQAEKK